MSSEQMEHTPGPWFVGETLRAEAMCIVGDVDSVVCEFPDRLSATVDADARLIAASPRLLKAAIAALPLLRDEAGRYLDDGANEPLEALRELESAIAQATNPAAQLAKGAEK